MASVGRELGRWPFDIAMITSHAASRIPSRLGLRAEFEFTRGSDATRRPTLSLRSRPSPAFGGRPAYCQRTYDMLSRSSRPQWLCRERGTRYSTASAELLRVSHASCTTGTADQYRRYLLWSVSTTRTREIASAPMTKDRTQLKVFQRSRRHGPSYPYNELVEEASTDGLRNPERHPH